MNEDWITMQEAAEILGMTKCNVRYRMERGDLAATKIRGTGRGPGFEYRFIRADVEHLRDNWIPKGIPAFDHTPTHLQCAYLAGLIDGEGSIIIKHKNHRQYSILLTIYNSHEPVLQWVTSHFGCGFVCTQRNQRDRDQVPVYAWTSASFRAYHVLRATLPYLIIKKAQAEIVIEFQEALTSKQRHRWNQITDDDLQWREEQRLRLSRLNRSRYIPDHQEVNLTAADRSQTA